ncbi:MAG: hypothetical protein ACK559_14255, partial [bacterium]
MAAAVAHDHPRAGWIHRARFRDGGRRATDVRRDGRAVDAAGRLARLRRRAGAGRRVCGRDRAAES